MTEVLLLSIAIRAAALGVAAWSWLRLRDWRLGVFTGALGLMVLRQGLTLAAVRSGVPPPASAGWSELPGLAVSLVAFGAAVFLGRLLDDSRRATRELREREVRFASLIENSYDMIGEIDETGCILFVSPSVERILGYPARALEGRIVFDLIHPEETGRLRRAFAIVRTHGRIRPAVFRVRHTAGDWRWLEGSARSFRTASGAQRAVFTVRDVSEIRAADAALRASQARFWSLTEGAPDPIVELSSTGRIVYASASFRRAVGRRDSEIAGQRLDRFVHPADAAQVERLLELLARADTSPARLLRLAAKDGSWRRWEVVGSGFKTAEGEIHGVTVFRDAEERLRADKELRVRSHQQAAVAELGVLALATTDLDHLLEAVVRLVVRVLDLDFATFYDLDRAGSRLVRRAEAGWGADARASEAIPSNASSQEGAALAAPEPVCVEDYEHDDRFAAPPRLIGHGVRCGLSVAVGAREHPLGVLAAYGCSPRRFGSDDMHFLTSVAHVTHAALERQRATAALQRSQEQLLRSQKLEALGRLAGGIAHDFNNLLTAMSGAAELLDGELEPGDERREDVAEIQGAIERGAELTARLLAFSRPVAAEPRVLDVNEAVRHVHGLMERVIGEDVSLEIRLTATPARIRAAPGRVEQVLMNLAVNAREALPEGGHLFIETSIVPRTEPDLAPDRPRAVRLRVRDTGVGMDETTRAHIFEPFFTARPGGARGTGLGLSIVSGIVEEHGGAIRVESQPGHGTQFEILLPEVSEAPSSAAPSDVAASRHGGETILVVEDEAALRRVTARALRQYGYGVLEAGNGAEALRVARACPGPIDLLVTDVVMPEIGGVALARQLGTERPGTAVLYVSGYPGEAPPDEVRLPETQRLLYKPFTPAVLARAVREVLDHAERVAAGPRSGEAR